MRRNTTAEWEATDLLLPGMMCFQRSLAEKYPESFDNSIPEELIYSGTKSLTDAIENSPLDAGKLVLSPTRTYAPVIKKILTKFSNKEITEWCIAAEALKPKYFIL
jgi:hypothetical protein